MLRSVFLAGTFLAAIASGAPAMAQCSTPAGQGQYQVTDGAGSGCTAPANATTLDTPTTNTVGTTDTVLRGADTVRHSVTIQLLTASACVALRFGAAANLTNGTSLLLGGGCSPAQPIGWVFDSGAVDTRAIHGISATTTSTVAIWVN